MFAVHSKLLKSLPTLFNIIIQTPARPKMETNHSGTSQFLPLSMTFGYLNDANTPTASDTDLQHDYELLYRRMMAVKPTLASLLVQTLSTHDVLRVVREIMVTHPGGYKHRDFLVVFRVMFDFMALVQVGPPATTFGLMAHVIH